MKTLKKVLCLVLALVMVVGTMAISAAAYTDEISEDYEEAVAVLSAIKVIDGYGDDVFGAKDGVTRAQALAFVVRAMLTRSTANKLTASNTAFADVSDDWAKGVVSYAVAEGMANGWDGKFAPNDPVTGFAFEKFVLTALDIEGEYTGANWENNVLLAASNAKLLEGMEEDFDLSKNLTREQAAKLAYNMIVYSPKAGASAYVVTDKDGKILYTGNDAVTALLMKQSAADNTLSTTPDFTGTMLKEKYGLTRTETTNNYGQTVVQYLNSENKAVVTIADEAVYSANGAVKKADVAKAIGAVSGKSADVWVWVDGVKAEASETINGDTTGTFSTLGDTVAVYKDGNEYNVVVTNTYIGTVTKVNKAVAATGSRAAVKRNVVLDNTNALTFETENFKENDIVLYTKVDGKIDTMALASSITGKITATGSDYIRVDGVKYNYYTGVMTDRTIGNTYTFYLDNQNNIILVTDAASGNTDVTYEKVYVLGFKSSRKDNTNGSTLFDQASSETWTVQAQIVDLKTGEVKVVDVATTTGTDKKVYLATPAGTVATGKVLTAQDPADVNEYVAAGYHDFAVIDGKYAIKTDALTTAKVTLNKSNANIATVDGTKLYANNKTVVYVLTGDKGLDNSTKYSVTTTTGLNAFPTKDAELENALVLADKDGYITAVYALKAAATPETAVNYAVYTGAGETVLDNDGNAVTLVKFTTGEYQNSKNLELTKNAVYDITVSDGKLSKADLKKGTEATVGKVSDGYFTDENGVVHNLSDKVVVLDADDGYKPVELKAKQTITFFADKDGVVEFIVVAEVDD